MNTLPSFMLSLLATLAVAAAAVHPNMVIGTNGIMKFDHWKNDAIPALNQTATPTQFVVATYWTSTTDCTGTVDIVHGTGFDVCFTDGYESYINKNGKSSGGYVSYSTDSYSTTDCTGAILRTLTYQLRETCTQSTGNTGQKYEYSLINSATPWTTFKFPAVLTKSYYAPATCSSTASPAVFTLTTATNCVLTGGAYPTYTYEKWTSCANNYITKTEYKGDVNCENLTTTGSSQVQVSTCAPNRSKYDTESQVCYSG